MRSMFRGCWTLYKVACFVLGTGVILVVAITFMMGFIAGLRDGLNNGGAGEAGPAPTEARKVNDRMTNVVETFNTLEPASRIKVLDIVRESYDHSNLHPAGTYLQKLSACTNDERVTISVARIYLDTLDKPNREQVLHYLGTLFDPNMSELTRQRSA